MSFYGNIKKVDSSVFTFDRRYNSRVAMDAAANTDGVYIGRYVLIEYGERFLKQTIQNSFSYDRLVKVVNGETRIANKQYIVIIKDDTEKVIAANLFDGDNTAFAAAIANGTLYKLKDNATIESLTVLTASNDVVIKATIESLEFRTNADIDLEAYGAVYDSTVWQKVYINNECKYIMVAELNAVVPKIELNLQNALTYSRIQDGEVEDELYAFNNDKTGVYRLVDTKETAISPSFNTNLDTELSYILNQPASLKLKVDNKYIDFHKKGFNKVYSYGEKEGDNVVSWVGEGLRVIPTNTKNEYNEFLANLSGDEQQVGTKILFMNVPIIGNTINSLYDLLFGETLEDKTHGGIRPYFKDFRPQVSHLGALQAEDSTGKLVDITINDKKCYVTGYEGESVEYEIPATDLFNITDDSITIKNPLKILPTTVGVKHKNENNTYSDLSTSNQSGNIFYYISGPHSGSPVQLVVPPPNGDTDNLEWISNVPEINEILGNNTQGLASLLRKLFGYADPLTGITKFYFYGDWAAEENRNYNDPCIINKPKIIGGYPITFKNITKTSPDLSNPSGVPIDYQYISAEIDETNYSDGHYFVDYDAWQLTGSPIKEFKLLIQKVDPDKPAKSRFQYGENQTAGQTRFKYNQNNCVIYHLNNDLYILSNNFTALQSYQYKTSSSGWSAEKKWLLLDITTDFVNISGIKINGSSTYSATVASYYQLPAGHIFLQIDLSSIANAPTQLVFTKTDYTTKIINIHYSF